MPARPPPTTSTRALASAALTPALRACRARHPHLLVRWQRHAPARDFLRVSLDALQQPPVDARHRQHARGAAPVEHRRERIPRSNHSRARSPSKRTSAASRSALGLATSPVGAARASAREHLSACWRTSLCVGAEPRQHAEAPQVLGGQVHAPVLGVLAHVAQDVRQLQRDAEFVGESFGLRRRRRSPAAQAEDRQAHAPDRSGDAAAVDDAAPRSSRSVMPSTSMRTPSISSPSASGGQREAPLRVGERDASPDRRRRRLRRRPPPASSLPSRARGLLVQQRAASRSRVERRRRRCRRCAGRTRRRRTSRGDARRAAA